MPPDCAKAAIVALGPAAEQGTGMGLKGQLARQIVADVVRNPRAFEAAVGGEAPVVHEPSLKVVLEKRTRYLDV